MTNKDRGHILLVEDEESLRNALKLNLELEGYEVISTDNGLDALNIAKEEYFDCIILDIMLPGEDGIYVCERIRLNNDKVPILFLSAKNTGADRVNGLRKGGDDYMTKPFNLEELLLRIEKLIIKNKKIDHIKTDFTTYHINNCEINFSSLVCIDVRGDEHQLTKKEVQFLKLLIENKNEVVSREHILKMVWGYNVFPTTRTVDNFIMNFRKYFEKDPRNPQHFFSIRGVGYKFVN